MRERETDRGVCVCVCRKRQAEREETAELAKAGGRLVPLVSLGKGCRRTFGISRSWLCARRQVEGGDACP